MARVFVDRIEGARAVLLIDGRQKRVPLASLPQGVREGCWLSEDLKSIVEEADAETVAARRARLVKDDGGDFSL